MIRCPKKGECVNKLICENASTEAISDKVNSDKTGNFVSDFTGSVVRCS